MTVTRRKVRTKNQGSLASAGRSLPLNMWNSYNSAPEFYYDVEFECVDCEKIEVWNADQQK